MPFSNRQEAARLLAQALSKYQGNNPLILAIPRGAVPMGKHLAQELGGELDVVLVHKLGAPGQPELAIGAVDETGHVSLNPYAKQLGISSEYIEREKNRELEVLQARRKDYSPDRAPIDPKDRVVILVDDGIATGSTMKAAIHSVREKNPKKIVVATPVAPPETIERLSQLADEVVCLETPQNFYAVGQFYEHFPQVSDEEVMGMLR